MINALNQRSIKEKHLLSRPRQRPPKGLQHLVMPELLDPLRRVA
jgi:hypothetical protein